VASAYRPVDMSQQSPLWHSVVGGGGGGGGVPPLPELAVCGFSVHLVLQTPFGPFLEPARSEKNERRLEEAKCSRLRRTPRCR
jgi:hypothetical protein